MNNKPIELECHDNIAVLRINRPFVHNAVNDKLMDLWKIHLDEIENDPCIRSIIITGTGPKTFCAGGDLKYFASLKTEKACIDMSKKMQSINNRLYTGKRVVIAAINGQTFGGGCEILTACHFRLGVPHATFAFKQAPNGLITGWGGCNRLIKLIGKSSALRLLLTGKQINAEEAMDMGLIDQIVEHEDLMPEAETLAKKINENYKGSIEAFLKMAEMSDSARDDDIEKYESETLVRLFLGEYFQKIAQTYLK